MITDEKVIEEFKALAEARALGAEDISVSFAIQDLVNMGVLKVVDMRRALVKKAFYARMKEARSQRALINELCLEFDCSPEFVKKCIYYYRNIRV